MKNFVFNDSFKSIGSEARQLREHIQIQSRHAEVIETHLMGLLDELGLKSKTVQIFDEISPLNDGLNLRRYSQGKKPYKKMPTSPNIKPETDNDWWPTNRKKTNYLVPNAGWQNHSIQGTTNLVYGISLFGVPGKKMEKIVEQISVQQAEKENFVPLFITDSTEFHIFRKYGYVFEYFPSPEKRAAVTGSISWSQYAQERLDFLIRKWGIVNMINIGDRTILTQKPVVKASSKKKTSRKLGPKKRTKKNLTINKQSVS